jgi:hypothetical protein
MEEREVQDVELVNLQEKIEYSEKHENRRRLDYDESGKVVNWVEKIVSWMKNLLRGYLFPGPPSSGCGLLSSYQNPPHP